MASFLGRSLSRRRIDWSKNIVVTVALAVTVVVSGGPFLALGGRLVTSERGWRAVTSVLSLAQTWRLLGVSVAIAAAVAVVALVVGVPMGVALGKTDVPMRRGALLLHGFPLFLPPFLVALGWFWFRQQVGIATPGRASLFFGPAGVIAVLGMCFSPIVTWLTVLGVRSVPSSQEDAALVVATPFRVIHKVLLPQALPSISFGILLVFALSLSDVGVPMFLRVRTFPAMVFSRLGGVHYAPGEALALSLPLVGVALILLLAERGLVGRRLLSSLAAGGDEPSSRVFSLGKTRWLVSAVVWTIASSPLIALGSLAVRARGVSVARAAQWLGDSVGVSIASAAAAATVVTAVGFVLGHRMARRGRGAGFIDALSMFAFVAPSAVLGVGMVAMWNHGSTQFIYTSMAVLVLGLSARYAMIPSRALAGLLVRTSEQYEQAAAVAGAGYASRLVRIVAPMHRFGLVGAWLLALVFGLRDLETVVIFYPPGLETLPVKIFTLEANGGEDVVAALSVTHAALTAVIVAVLFFSIGRSNER